VNAYFFTKKKRVWVTLLSVSVLCNTSGQWISSKKKKSKQIEMQQQEETRYESGVVFNRFFLTVRPHNRK